VIKKHLAVKFTIHVDYVMMIIIKDLKVKDAKLKQWIDIMLRKLDAGNAKLNRLHHKNVRIAKFNSLVTIAMFANYSMIIQKNKYTIVINAKCVE
jgi:hypothetical protein